SSNVFILANKLMDLQQSPAFPGKELSLFSRISSSFGSGSLDEISIDRIRLPPDSCCPVSMLPLHSAVASARLKSVLGPESQSWGWVPQGLSMPL
ncbi:hypothetical protein IHE45_04G060400, partial [Dioscorea alata]